MLSLGLQVVLSVQVTETPLRFGLPVPAAAIADGLRLRGPGQLQWRRLPVGAAAADPVWVEIALHGVRGNVRIVAGGSGPSPSGSGAAFVRTESERRVPHGREVTTQWSWCDGTRDGRVRVEFHAETLLDGELFGPGEVRTRWRRGPAAGDSSAEGHANSDAGRTAVIGALSRRTFERSGLLPRGGRLGKVVRRQLLAVHERLVELPGERGAGDFARSDGIITNGEFDTSLGLLRLAMATGDRAAFARGLRSAQHLRDRDLDSRTGLPFPHGADHRTGIPVCGHVWLQGLMLAGLLTADDDLIGAARAVGCALAARPPMGQGRSERARDYAWPLLELEALMAVDPDPVLAAAADRLARSIDGRFDPMHRTYRFGEGEQRDGVYLERGWITGGLVLPALQRHLDRRHDRAMSERLRLAQRGLLDRLDTSRAGIPTHWRCASGRFFAEHRVERDVRALFMLEGLRHADLRRILRRTELRDCIAQVPSLEDPDLPTSFSLVARCWWVYR